MDFNTVKKYVSNFTKINTIVLIPFSLLILSYISNNIHRTEAKTLVANGILTPGQTIDTTSHIYGSSDLTIPSNWSYYSNGTNYYLPNWSSDGLSINLSNTLAREKTYAVLNYALDMTQKVTFSGTIKSAGTAGDYIGLIFSPVEKSKIITGGIGSALGIKGLTNTVFLGRDLYYNPMVNSSGQAIDNSLGQFYTSSTGAWGSTQIRIETTNANGDMNGTGTTTSGINPIASVPINTSGDTYTISWIPVVGSSTSTTTKGDLSLIINGTKITYSNYIINNHMTLSISAGGEGSINVGAKSIGFSGASFEATKATAPISVNYINSRSGSQIIESGKSTVTPSTTIVSNIGDSVGVIAPGASPNDTNTYDYSAPTLAGYSYDSSNSLTVANDTNNTINVYYTPVTETPNFQSFYSSGTPGTSISKTLDGVSLALPSTTPEIPGTAPSLPVIQALSGYYGEIAPTPTLNVPPGYVIDKIIGPDNNIYNTLNNALAANPLKLTSPSTETLNTFSVVIKALDQSANTHYNFVGAPQGTITPNVVDNNFLKGITGQPITSQNIQNIIDQYNLFVSSNKDWNITSLTFPDGTISNLSNIDNLTNIILGNKNNAYLNSSTNIFTLNLTYIGQFSVQGQDITFGTIKVSGTGQINSTSFPDNVIVTDTRPNPGNWKLSIEQKIPIHPIGKEVSTEDENNIIYFGTSLNTKKPLSNTDGTPNLVDIYSNSAAKQGSINVTTNLSGNYKFYLYMPSENQKVGDFEGAVEWVLSDVP